MTAKLAKILYKLILFLDSLCFFYTKKRFHNKDSDSLLMIHRLKDYIYDHLRNTYVNVKIQEKQIYLFSPTKLSQWRAKTLFSKEPETIKWIDSFENKNGNIFWDIGANIGLYSIYGAIKKDKLKVIAFEPSTLNLNLLSKNISINNLSDKIIINQIGLTDSPNKFILFNESSPYEGSADSSFGVNFNFEGKKLNVINKYKIFGNSINYLLENQILEVPTYIKLDVDGIEHLILKGADAFLNNKKIKSISIELNKNFKEQYNGVCDLLFKSKFRLTNNKNYTNTENFEKNYNYIFERDN